MSHLIFTYDNPADPISTVSHETLADAKAELANRVDAIVHYLLHAHFDVKVVLIPAVDNGETVIIHGLADDCEVAFSVERKVGVLA